MLTCIPTLLPPTIRSLIVVRQVCLYGLLAVLCPASAAQAQYRFDSWTADNGLPQNSIHAIHQARDGYLWLATSDGLVRFDGVRFTVFNKSNSPGIGSNWFTCLYEDRQGDLWIGTENGGVTRRRGASSPPTRPPMDYRTMRSWASLAPRLAIFGSCRATC
jgi:ligand-binding sensor domain-containing protein